MLHIHPNARTTPATRAEIPSAALEQLLRGFNAAHNARRQRVLDAKTPNQVVAERL